VALYSAKHDRSTIRFNLINPDTGNRIRMLTVDGGTEKEVERRNLVKGYEFKKDTYLLLTDEDFDSVKVESSSIMAIEKFVEAKGLGRNYHVIGCDLIRSRVTARSYNSIRHGICCTSD
jgi:DNA end-binding protein Ku